MENVKSFYNSWGATKVRGNSWIIRGTYRENKIKKNITLSRFIMNPVDSSPVRFINNNPLDHRKSNLTVGYKELQKIRGNDYEEVDDNTLAIILTDRNGKEKARTLIDKDDLEKVLSKGTWYAEQRKDTNSLMAQNATYTGEKKLRKKIMLHSFIMGVNSKQQIKHCDGNTLNNRKSNLKVFSQTMMNDYEEIDDLTIAIILRNKYGEEKARTLIDKDDLERVINNGFTWCYFKSKGEPYAVVNSPEGLVYMHRFIMDTPKDMMTDHIYHNTLDNRKSQLRNVTNSQNQQNRKGVRKGNITGIRCVTWDKVYKSCVIIVKGKYIGRTKDIKKAEKIAGEKIKELMPYAVK